MNSESESERKVKSCKGCLFYTLRSSKSINPTATCVGISATLKEFPSNAAGRAELGLSKRTTKPANFSYVCLGYSLYLDNKDSKQQLPKLPFCAIGLEMLMAKKKKPSRSPADHVDPVSVPNKTQEHKHTTPQPQISNPPHVRGEEFFNIFKRNAGVVASGVGKNMKRVGNYVKETIDGILNPPK